MWAVSDFARTVPTFTPTLKTRKIVRGTDAAFNAETSPTIDLPAIPHGLDLPHNIVAVSNPAAIQPKMLSSI